MTYELSRAVSRTSVTHVQQRTGWPRRLNCPLCHGRQTVSLRRGRRVAWLVQCFRCHADYPSLARALTLPLEQRRERHGPPVRVRSEWERVVADLLRAAEARQERIRPWLDVLERCREHRLELDAARDCRELATLLDDVPISWDLADEAAAHERRAHLLACALNVVREAITPDEMWRRWGPGGTHLRRRP